jgi:uncharacterized membrane protein
MFPIYFKLGFDHILDVHGFDHILFVIALCAVYQYTEWKKILVLVTAFTIGHSLTLALSALHIVSIDADLVEFLIPLTILITAIFNILPARNTKSISQKINVKYLLALVFGLVHGLGFSNYFKALLGKEESIIEPLFAFNIGVELGQIIIVFCTVLIGYVLINWCKAQQRDWTTFVSGAAAGIAITLMIG